jgi:hypothetical protein
MEHLIKAKKFLGCNSDYMSLMDHLDSESYYSSLKDPDLGLLWPFLTEVELMPGEVVEYWEVRRVSWFAGYVLLFESVEMLNEYVRLRELKELNNQIKK